MAVDAAGHVGAFVTAGIGPIAATALDAAIPSIHAVGKQVEALPRVTTARMFIEDKGWGSFQALAEAGIFAFDWQDVNRVRGFVRAYEAFAAPTKPVSLANLPQNVERRLRLWAPSTSRARLWWMFERWCRASKASWFSA